MVHELNETGLVALRERLAGRHGQGQVQELLKKEGRVEK